MPVKYEDDIGLLERQEIKTEKPKQYQVVLFNDDFTPFELVLHVLQAVFKKSNEEAMHLMLEAHTSGRSLCGVYTKDVAETKVGEATEIAKAEGYALRFEVQEAK